MKSTAHLGGHPLHAMLIVVPAGGVLFTLVFDLVHLVTGDDAYWLATRPVLLVALIGAFAAAVPGLIDLATIVPKGRPTAIGLAHMALNVGVLIVLGVNAWLRWNTALLDTGTPGFGWSVLATALLAASGTLGWTLVQTHHIRVLEVGEGGDAPMLDGRHAEPVGLHSPDEASVT